MVVHQCSVVGWSKAIQARNTYLMLGRCEAVDSRGRHFNHSMAGSLNPSTAEHCLPLGLELAVRTPSWVGVSIGHSVSH